MSELHRVEVEFLQLAQITRDRLDDWAKGMADANATPILALAIGHGPSAGELHLFTVSEVSNDDLAMFLQFALRELSKRRCAA